MRRLLSDQLHRHPAWLMAALLAPPLLWFGPVYLGSLAALLANALFRLDDFTGQVVREIGLSNFVALLEPANLDAARRSIGMALAVTLACSALAFPLALVMARAGGARKAVLYIAVMLPLWSSYLVRLYAWKLLLAKEGAISWAAERLHAGWVIEGLLALPLIGGPSLSFSTLGTFVVFVYMWLPFMVLPLVAAIERIPASTLEASADLGAQPSTTFRRIVLPLAMPGLAAGSIFTFSLTLGDYIIPQVIGDSTLYIGQVIFRQQGVAGNLPFAAAFSLVPIVAIALYLWWAKRKGAFDAL
ncbi:MAG: ABC transporter permease [Burkholderiaceae bacterium]|nr:ABC transporter permease [Burkholderiaceae bacterium]